MMDVKPVVMEQFSTVHSSFVIDFQFKNNITILMGDSGTGKTAVFSSIRECAATNPQLLCLNYLDYQKDIRNIIRMTKGKMIVIDNADILLDDEMRKYISLDGENQYLIIGRNLFATKENLYEFHVEKKVIRQGLRLESTCRNGDNCTKWILNMAENEDVTINLRNLMDFGQGEFEINILNTNQVVHNMGELIPIAGRYV